VGIGGLVDVVRTPRFATGVGLVLYGANADRYAQFGAQAEKGVRRILPMFREWIGEIF